MKATQAPKTLKFVHNQGDPAGGLKKRKISVACHNCRQRKTKCDGKSPCTRCVDCGAVCQGYPELRNYPRKKKSTHASDLDPLAEFSYLMCEEGDENGEWRDRNSKGRPPQTGPVERRNSTASVLTGREDNRDWELHGKTQNAQDSARARPVRRLTYPRNQEDGRTTNNRSPMQHYSETSHRVPYFRYFGPTAIVPGFKQMVVSVRDRRRSTGGSMSATSPMSGIGYNNGPGSSPESDKEPRSIEDLPCYDPNDPAPIHPVIESLVCTFFLHLGCNFPFLKKDRFLRMVKEKRVEPILVDAVCALAARFSDLPVFMREHKVTKSLYGNQYAQRAMYATVDTFPCPSVAAVQALILIAYERFGAGQDSALWMYLGAAIRMTVDLGLQKLVGVMYQGEKDPWYTRTYTRKGSGDGDAAGNKDGEGDTLSPEEQKELEEERKETFWAVFLLDRVISSGTGRPVSFKDDDYELALPQTATEIQPGWPAPMPTLIKIVQLYGKVSDVLNNIREEQDLTPEKIARLTEMESELTMLYQKQDPHLHFNAVNFQRYVSMGQGTTFILLHFWFHTLIIILHQPTLLAPFVSLKRIHQLLPNSRELSMSSAKTIADILAFAELIDPKSFIGNPFTSQPMYIAACAFLMESIANAPEPSSRDGSPTPEVKPDPTKPDLSKRVSSARTPSGNGDGKSSKHSLLAAAANQNYQRCYKSLQQLNTYWSGCTYILTALDQKSKGIWDCETYTFEEYESTKLHHRRAGSISRFPTFDNPASPNVPPIAFSLTGTTNSPNSSLTFLYTNNMAGVATSQPSSTQNFMSQMQQQQQQGQQAQQQQQSEQQPARQDTENMSQAQQQQQQQQHQHQQRQAHDESQPVEQDGDNQTGLLPVKFEGSEDEPETQQHMVASDGGPMPNAGHTPLVNGVQQETDQPAAMPIQTPPTAHVSYGQTVQNVPDTGSIFGSPYPQFTTSAMRHSAQPPAPPRARPHRLSTSSIGSAALTTGGQSAMAMSIDEAVADSKLHGMEALPGVQQGGPRRQSSYTPSTQHSATFSPSGMAPASTSPSSIFTDGTHASASAAVVTQQQQQQQQQQQPHAPHSQHPQQMRANANGDPNCGPANANGRGGYVLVNGVVPSPMGGGVLVQNMSLEPQHHNHNHHHHHQQSTHHQHHHHQQRHHQQQQTYLGPPVSITDMVTFESNQDSEQTLGSLGLPSEMMPPWLEYVNPGEFFDLFDMGGGSVAGGGAVVE